VSDYIDEIAVMRALEGDRAVYGSLTRAERVEFLIRSAKRAQDEGMTTIEREDGSTFQRQEYTHWLTDLLGVEPESLRRAQHRVLASVGS